MPNILIPNPQHLQELIEKIAQDGKEHFHVIADFDRTLTTAFIDGKPTSALTSIFEEECHLGPEFGKKAKELFNTYYPQEIDLAIPLEKKKELMTEWRTRTFALMLETGITRDMIKQTMKSGKIKFRPGYEIFFDLLNDNNIPLLIFSASGLGYDGIYYGLEHNDKLYENINIISNAFVRNEQGQGIAVREPIIHSFNKGETVVHDLPVYEDIKKRKNVILLGDSVGDANMADGFDYKNIIKI